MHEPSGTFKTQAVCPGWPIVQAKSVGAAVGAGVGAVGLDVGPAVGAFVGDFVGALVGVLVGVFVGEFVIRSHEWHLAMPGVHT